MEDPIEMLNSRTGPVDKSLMTAIQRCVDSDSSSAGSNIAAFKTTGHTAKWGPWEYTIGKSGAKETTLALVVRNRQNEIVQPISKQNKPKTVFKLLAPKVRVYAGPADRLGHIKQEGYAVTSAKSIIHIESDTEHPVFAEAHDYLNSLLTTGLAEATVEHMKDLKPKQYMPSEGATVTDPDTFKRILMDPHDDRWALPTEQGSPAPKLSLKRTMLSKSIATPASGPNWEMFGEHKDFAQQGAPDYVPQLLKVLLHDGQTTLQADQMSEIRPGAAALVEFAVQGWYMNTRNKHKPQHTVVQWIQSAQIFCNGSGGPSGSSGGINLEAAIAEIVKAETMVSDADANVSVPRGDQPKKKRRI